MVEQQGPENNGDSHLSGEDQKDGSTSRFLHRKSNEKEVWSLIFKENIANRHKKLETEQQEIRGIIAQTVRPGAADWWQGLQ